MALMFQPFKKYATFSGRARRSEYWLFYLLFLIVYIVAAGIGGAMVGGAADPAKSPGMALPLIVLLIFLLPLLAVGARRLHDIDKSGWWQLISLIPLLGALLLIFWYCKSGTPGPNRFGDDPKGSSVEAFV